MISSVLARKLRFLRKEADYTQEEVAKYLNIERQAYSNYENEMRNPPLDVIVKLANFYHVTVDYLVKESTIASRQYQPLTSAEAAFLESFRSLSPQSQRETLQFIQFKHNIS
ncbi:MAG: helix-turn-helix transcriptional regulator [Lachnospiraceae bacterium]|nr:helix-turn-helix transcriptional regulator [Lachnospiraceae bacterium]MDD3797192.1 helix-turn-helix transcriptional regulator [Lachnospiraceae bacterium]